MKLLLVDGSAVLHRAYHAYPPLRAKNGTIAGAVYGTVSILINALNDVEPTHVVVAWDLPVPTFRHEMYVGYKAQRPKADEEMVEQIPLVKELINKMGLKQVEVEKYEADDIIGTLAEQMSNQKFSNSQIESEKSKEEIKVIILTGDQDTMQLVSDRVKILTPAKGNNPPVLYGIEEVKNKYGVRPDQIVDYKALIGDPSDNIPGVMGIGKVTASKLLNEYETLDGIYEALNTKSETGNTKQITNFKLGEKVAQKLIDGRDSAFLSRDLSRIVTDMDITVDEEEIEYEGLEREELKEELGELGFKSLTRRVFGDEEKKRVPDNQMGLFS